MQASTRDGNIGSGSRRRGKARSSPGKAKGEGPGAAAGGPEQQQRGGGGGGSGMRLRVMSYNLLAEALVSAHALAPTLPWDGAGHKYNCTLVHTLPPSHSLIVPLFPPALP